MEKKKGLNYAGFVSRLIAWIIDSLIAMVPGMIVSFLLMGWILSSPPAPYGTSAEEAVQRATLTVTRILTSITSMFIGLGVGLIVYLYNNVYLVATKGASIGKNFMKLKVTDLEGKYPIGYGKALLREVVGKFVSSIILYLGYLLIIVDERKQGLHDKIAGTYVIKEE